LFQITVQTLLLLLITGTFSSLLVYSPVRYTSITDILDYHCCVRETTLLPLFIYMYMYMLYHCMLSIVAIDDFYLRRIYDMWRHMPILTQKRHLKMRLK